MAFVAEGGELVGGEGISSESQSFSTCSKAPDENRDRARASNPPIARTTHRWRVHFEETLSTAPESEELVNGIGTRVMGMPREDLSSMSAVLSPAQWMSEEGKRVPAVLQMRLLRRIMDRKPDPEWDTCGREMTEDERRLRRTSPSFYKTKRQRSYRTSRYRGASLSWRPSGNSDI